MQSNIIRGARRLLVTAGVITLVCSVVAPAAVSASNAGGNVPQESTGERPEPGAGRPEAPGGGLGNGNPLGDGEQPASEQGATKRWVCHRTAAEEVNPWELVEVSEHAVQVHQDHHDDWFLDDDDVEALSALLDVELHPAALQALDEDQLAALHASCAARQVVAEGEIIGGGDGGGNIGDGDSTGGDNSSGGGNTGGGGSIGGDDGGDTGGDDGNTGAGGSGQQPSARDPEPIQVGDEEVTPPAAPPAPLPEPQISADEVVAPPPQTPVVNTPAPAGTPKVLGVTTTRIPTRELASGASVTSLPRTGTDSTTFLALAGGLLVATGVGLEALGRRGHLAAAGGRR